MSGRGHQLIHSDAFAAELEALGLDSTLFGAAGVPAPVFANLIPRRAGVWDALPNTFGYGDFSSAFTRASDGLYRDGQGIWRVAGNNVLRPHHDANGNFLGVLFEPEEINKCENWNANPDASLTNISLAGPPEASLTRVLDAAALESAGLSQEVCTSGYVYFLDNLAGASSAQALAVGQAGNSNAHTVSVFAKNHASTASNCSVSMNDPAFGGTPFTSTDYARYARSNTPDLATRRLIIDAPANSACFFVLNQLEESPVASSPIITQGASATRAADALIWPSSGNTAFLNSIGMLVVRVRPGFGFAVGATNDTQRILNSGTALVYYIKAGSNGQFVFRSGTSTNVSVDLAAQLAADTEYLIAAHWGGSSAQIGVKVAGVWTWGTAGSFHASGINDNGTLQVSDWANVLGPVHVQDLFLWNRNAGTALLEKLFSGIAN